jgi:lysophospholipase L1-like esterase
MLMSIMLPLMAKDNVSGKNKLPNVLIIGDSISLGYTPFVKKILKGKAVVEHNNGNGNAEYTGSGIVMLDKWLGSTKWDVIHFNWGLWDMYGWRFLKEDRSPAMYKKRLEKLVARLKKTGAVLIWGTTTPACPDPEVTMLKRFSTKVVISSALENEYRESALQVMKQNNIKIDDLYSLMHPERKKYALAANNVHYTLDGYKKLAEQVAESIETALKERKK